MDNSIIVYPRLESFFIKKLEKISCRQDTKSYIISILIKYRNTNFDYSNQSITLVYAKAKETSDFATFQNIGDYVFFSRSIFPEHFVNENKEYYTTLAQLSYYSCYRLINKQWIIYENLADEFNYLTKSVGSAINNF